MTGKGDIQRAVEALEERKKALGIGDGSGGGDLIEGEERVRLLLSGMDIDIEELTEALSMVARAERVARQAGIPAEFISPGFFMDGLATGLVMAEQRRRREIQEEGEEEEGG